MAHDTTIAALLAAFDDHRDRVAIRHAGGEWTYGELRDRIYRTARVLRANGLRRGDVVALLTGNRPETYVLRYAANTLGCCVTVLYDDLAPSLLAEMLRTAEAAALVYDADRHTGEAREVLAEVPGVTGLSLDEATEAESAKPIPVQARPEDLASIQFTGGSTGVPKGIPRQAKLPGYLTPAALAAWTDAVQLLCTPIGHLGGTLSGVVLAAGGRVVLHERFDAGEVLAAIEREQVSFLWLPPRLLHQLLDHPALATTDTASLRSIALGGSASTPHRVAEAIERFGPIVAQGYGTNEAAQITWLTPREHERPELISTVGRPVPGIELTIRDAAGDPTDGTGEIWVRGPGVMTGYHRRPELTEQVLRDGWFHTGDLGHLDAEGYLTIVGRSKDVILAANGHVYPSAIEDVLLRHPAIADVIVFGVTDGSRDEHVHAAVVTAPGSTLSEDEVIRWVGRERGAAYAPEVVTFLDELPQTGSHKPDRRALRQLLAERG
ncbi:AMP-binding protein [Kutzneria sp. CA-103260]|uniref:AMP-binding protein n=1 Tax=Kutzneria sp. CA-103260 TaxID=2802641 RepID=UPI001BA5B62E|nr:AMP-binding protein [Kutzneria sp. CA-103260]